ncbi:helix-turn-helix transcriptional regulator [Kibdelosporangium persicum]|uniref:Helix-turn-helix motif n=1 Tax=Kibdelosporangium persicum TaxID=2698649 RepID=A0ABX2F365_9PSEU|nr:helix-turn-helix transcriptional regulator [Kibdelosporangium persicum]NRN65771.1 Helix-turn-helix motif [Kibdelosporangium persicum]
MTHDDAAEGTTLGEDVEPTAGRLAEEIRRRRKAADLSHAQLAMTIGYSREYVRRAESPRKGLPSVDLVRALDHALGDDGTLLALREQADVARQARRRSRAGSLVAGMSMSAIPTTVSGVPALALDTSGGADTEVAVQAPPGRFFTGTSIAARAYPASDDGRILTTVPTGFADDMFLRRPRRGLVIGVTKNEHGVGLFGLDSRQARRRLAGAPEGARLLMSRAYALDDLTLGILWAVANLDEALLDDDATLSASRGQLAVYEQSPRSAAGCEIAADLAPASRMWLGSQFCASHILRHTDTLTGMPAFWTREQRGEEASTWLLFAHKYDYLRQSASTASGADAGPTRAFCVPASAVANSSRPERILLLLAVALMESFGITVDVCAEPEYVAVPGFVFDGHRRAIVANWVGADGIWQVDVTDTPPLLREFADATGYARSHSIAAAATPSERLHALADYLDLDWAWLVHRCRELGDYGSAGIAQPRSRLLSTEGVDQACRFLAQADQVGR